MLEMLGYIGIFLPAALDIWLKCIKKTYFFVIITFLTSVVYFILYILANIRKTEKFVPTDRKTNLLVEDHALVKFGFQ